MTEQNKNISVPERTFSTLLLCSFRYALGRKTYIAGECCEWLRRYWEHIPEGYREQIHRDIKHAIECNIAGDDCDIEEWKTILKLKAAL